MPRIAQIPVLFGKRVRKLRTLKRMTQEDLAERSSVSGKFIGQIERGTANPSLKVLAQVGQALGVELPELLRLDEVRSEVARDTARAAAAAETVADYLAKRPLEEVERALRILEAALDFGPPPSRR